MFDRLNNLPGGVEHVILQLGIPIAYPRMVFLETALESKFNPLVALGRNGSMGLSGFVNKFNAEAELLDDLVRIHLTVLYFDIHIYGIRTIIGRPGVTRSAFWSP